MAASVATNMMTQQLVYLARKYGLDEVRLNTAIVNLDGYEVTGRLGSESYRTIMRGRLSTPTPDELDAVVAEIKQRLSRFQLDVRQNAIENFDDIIALLNRCEEKNYRPDILVVSPQQREALGLQGMSTIYGLTIQVAS